MVILLYASRACYNLVVLALSNIESIDSFDYDWYNVSDQVGVTHSSSLLLCRTEITRFLCRRICAPVWETPVTWCSVWFCSSGSCCPRLWWSSFSGCENRPRTGWAGAERMSVYSVKSMRASADLTEGVCLLFSRAVLLFPATSSQTGRISSTIPDATTATMI